MNSNKIYYVNAGECFDSLSPLALTKVRESGTGKVNMNSEWRLFKLNHL